MSVAFRQEFLGGSAVVRVDAAFGADLTVNSAAWSWTDITTDVLYASYAGVTISPMGRSDESSTAQPSGFSFSLKNDSGTYTVGNPTSANYPNIRRNTPVRVVVNLGAGDFVRAQGYVNGWIPSWDERGSHSIVRVSCSGALRRLNQGSPAVQSAIYRSTSVAPGLVVYAPLEDESGSTSIYVQSPNHPQNGLFGGSFTPAGETTMGGTKQAIVLQSTSYLGLNTQGYQFSGHWTSDFFFKFTGSDPASETVVMRCYTTGAAAIVDAVYGGVTWGVRCYTAAGVSLGTAIFGPPVGQATGWWHWRLMAHDAGSGNTDYQLIVSPIIGTPLSSATVTVSGSPGNLTGAIVQPSANLDGVAMAHWSIFDQWNFSAVFAAAYGYDGESPTTRIARLAAEEGLELTTTGSSSVTMGPQKPGSLLSLLRECEAADGGVLFDGRNAGLSYIAESGRVNVAATMTLAAASKEVIGAPAATHDDQRDLNRATVSLSSGAGSATFEQFTGTLGSATIGVYETSLTANLHDAGDAQDLAAWRVHLGQADGLRYPSLSLDLIGTAKRTGTTAPTAWLNCTVGSRIDVTGLRSVAATFPPGDLQVLVEGWSETITPKTWTATVNASPYGPWNLGVLDTNRADCGASVTGSTMTTSSTTVDVMVSDACTWSHAGGDFSVTIGGEQMTVTAVSATAATTPSLVAVGTAASQDGFNFPRSVTPGLPGGATAAGNLLIMLASCRDTNAFDTGMYLTGATGWKKIIDGVNFAIFAKVHSGSETAPTLHIWPYPTIVGDTLIAQIASFSGKWGDPKSQLIAFDHQLNAAAQDITYPDLQVTLSNALIIWAGWKADDWTSVATIAGASEISEATTTAGNDAGIVWDAGILASPARVPGGVFSVTGGTSQISRGCILALRYLYQTFTVTRGVNGITRAHGLGEEVHVTSPLTAARQ